MADKHGIVISDLHLLARRIQPLVSLQQLLPAAPRFNVIVLNGDIFDFAWSSLPPAASFQHAITLIKSLLAAQPASQIHYILGNHDAVVEFQPYLQQLVQTYPQFHLHLVGCRFGNNYFTHGDVTNVKPRNLTQLHQHPRWQHHAYDYAVAANLHGMIGKLQPLHYWLERVYQLAAQQTDITTLEHIYFGHIHVAFKNMAYKNIMFHNTGAGIKRLALQPLQFSWTDQ